MRANANKWFSKPDVDCWYFNNFSANESENRYNKHKWHKMLLVRWTPFETNCWGSADFLPPSLMCPVFPAPLCFLFVCLPSVLCPSHQGLSREHSSWVSLSLALWLHIGSPSVHQESPAIRLLNPCLRSQYSLNRQLCLAVTYQTSALYQTWFLSSVSNFFPLLSTSGQCALPRRFLLALLSAQPAPLSAQPVVHQPWSFCTFLWTLKLCNFWSSSLSLSRALWVQEQLKT